jgi:hypothetical protein
MVKQAKTVKWALGADEPEDNDFLTNEDIVGKNTNKKTKDVLWPGKGPHTFTVKRLMVKDNKNGDPRISAMLIMTNPKKADSAVWNGYLVWDGFNVTEQGKSFLNRFLKGLGLSYQDFLNKTKAVEEQDRSQIVQIAGTKFGEDAVKDPTLRALIRVKPADDYNDDEHMEIARYLPAAEDDDDDADEDGAEEVASLDADEPDEDGDGDDEYTLEDLQGMTKKELKAVAEEAGLDKSALKGLSEGDIIELLMSEDEAGVADVDPQEELREALNALTMPELKKRALRLAKKAGEDTDDMPTKKKDIVEWVVGFAPPF